MIIQTKAFNANKAVSLDNNTESIDIDARRVKGSLIVVRYITSFVGLFISVGQARPAWLDWAGRWQSNSRFSMQGPFYYGGLPCIMLPNSGTSK